MKLTTEARKHIPAGKFALPGRRFPVEDRAHAANAKARATQGVKAGTLSEEQAAKVRAKANRMLSK
jgi:hypothetical protein